MFQIRLLACWLDLIKSQSATQMMRFNWHHGLVHNRTSCPTYGQSVLCAEHLAVSSATGTTLCGSRAPSWHGLFPLLGCQRSPPPSAVAFATLHPQHQPLFFFCLIEIQLGTRTMPISWHQILERATQGNQPQSFLPRRRPPNPPITVDRRQQAMGVFLGAFICWICSSFATWAFNMDIFDTVAIQTSCSEAAEEPSPVNLSLTRDRVSLTWTSRIDNISPSLYSAAEQPFSHHPQLAGEPWKSKHHIRVYKKTFNPPPPEWIVMEIRIWVYILYSFCLKAQSQTAYFRKMKVRTDVWMRLTADYFVKQCKTFTCVCAYLCVCSIVSYFYHWFDYLTRISLNPDK